MLASARKQLVVAAALFCVAMLSSILFPGGGYVLAFGPLAGLGLAAVLLSRRYCVSVFLASSAFYLFHLARFPVDISFFSLLCLSLLIAFGYGLQATYSASCTPRIKEMIALDHVSDVIFFQLNAGVVAASLSATCGCIALWLGGFVPLAKVWQFWLWWWLWDALGVLMFPVLCLCFWGEPKNLWLHRRSSLLPMNALVFLCGAGLMLLVPNTTGAPTWIMLASLAGAVLFLSQTSGIILHITGDNLRFERQVFEKAHELANARSAVLLANDEIQDLDLELAQSLVLLQQREQHLEAIVETATDAIVSFDEDGRLVDANSATVQMFGYSRNELQDMNLSDLLPSFLSKDVAPDFNQTNPWLLRVRDNHEIEGLHADGSSVEVGCVISLMNAEDGMQFTAILRDISERRRIEKMKSEFVSVVSHELRTPLSALHGSLCFLENGLGGEMQQQGQKLVSMAMRNSLRLKRLVDDILDFEKLQSGTVSLDMVEFDPTSLLHRALVELGALAEKANVTITPRIEGEQELTMVSDPNRFEQVVINLVSNAIKFSPANSAIEVSLEPTPDDGQLRFAVTDQGPGIPEEQMPLLFQRFSQLDSSTTRSHGGTGLGLAICKELVARLGGTIGVDSKPGEGSTFWFVLPLSFH